MRITDIKARISKDAVSEGRGSAGWTDFLAELSAFIAAMPAQGLAEPEFCRQALPVMGNEHEAALMYLHRKGIIWRRIDGTERRIFPRRPDQIGHARGRPPRSRPIDIVERELHRAFSDGITAVVDALDRHDEAAQQSAATTVRKAAERVVRRGATWAAVRTALRVYRPDAITALRRYETAFDPRSGECLIDAPLSVPRTRAGASLTDRVLRAVEAAGPGGATRSRLARATSSKAADITTALASLEADGLLIPRLTRRGAQGSRPALRYTLGAGHPAAS